MSLCERPTHWLPQNPLAFIINKRLLIIQAPARPIYCMKGGRERENGWNETQRGDVYKKGDKTASKKTFWEKSVKPVTCGSHPHPIYFHFIISLISITSHTSSPLFIFLLKCSNFYGLGERERERRWLQRQADDGGRKRD